MSTHCMVRFPWTHGLNLFYSWRDCGCAVSGEFNKCGKDFGLSSNGIPKKQMVASYSLCTLFLCFCTLFTFFV